MAGVEATLMMLPGNYVDRVEEEAAKRSAEFSELREVYLFSKGLQQGSVRIFVLIYLLLSVFKLNVCKDIFSNGTALKKGKTRQKRKELTSCLCYFCILLSPLLTLKVNREENQRLRHYSPSNGRFHISPQSLWGKKNKKNPGWMDTQKHSNSKNGLKVLGEDVT